MRKELAVIVFIAILTIAGACARCAEPPVDPDFQPSGGAIALPVIPAAAAAQTLRTGAVIKVDGSRVYVDRGESDGISQGMSMDVYKLDPIKDLNGVVLDEEEIYIGRIRIAEVKQRLSIGEVTESAGKGEFERGFFVRYYIAAEKAAAAPSAAPAPQPAAEPAKPQLPFIASSAGGTLNLDEATGDEQSETVLKTGNVVRVATEPYQIFVDKGLYDGVAAGMNMEVVKLEPLKGVRGELLDEIETPIGWIKAVVVNPRASVCEVVSRKGEFERGQTVRFYAKAEKTAAQKSEEGRCPPGMIYDSGGQFVFTPGSIFSSEQPKEQIAKTQPFCIDMQMQQEADEWEAARTVCKRLGKRLCTREELQKVCAVWEKPKPCPKELWIQKACPQQKTVIDFYRSQEWTADLTADKDGNVGWEANSCSCPGTSPVCTHCVYKGCGVAKKPFRCCDEPLPAQKPAATVPQKK